MQKNKEIQKRVKKNIKEKKKTENSKKHDKKQNKKKKNRTENYWKLCLASVVNTGIFFPCCNIGGIFRCISSSAIKS